MTSRILEHYNQNIKLIYLSKYNLQNIYNIPKIKKIILTIFFKENLSKKNLISLLLFLEIISGQKADILRLKKNLSFQRNKIGTIVGCKVSLNKKIIFIFLDFLINIIFPKIYNLDQEISSKLDKQNNYTFNIKDIFIFDDIEKEYNKFSLIKNLNISLIFFSKEKNKLINIFNLFQLPKIK